MASPDHETKDSFADQMNKTVFSGFKLTGVGLGVKLGLFKVFGGEPLTSQEVADRANCKERYVREWLHHMVMCDVVDVDPTGRLFSLPGHRRDVLTGDQQFVNIMGPAFPALHIPHHQILSCFAKDGPEGLPFEDVYPFFAERALVNRGSLAACAEFIRDHIPGIKEKLESGIRVCDIGTGNGGMLIPLARQFPRSQFVGLDLSEDLLVQAREVAERENLSNVQCLLQNATELGSEYDDSFDLIYIRDVLHDISHVSKALACFYRVLRPGGQLSIVEVNVSENPYASRADPAQKQIGSLAYIISTYHCLPASLVVPGSAGLGAGSGVETIVRYLEQAGFVMEGHPEKADFFNVHLVCRKPR